MYLFVDRVTNGIATLLPMDGWEGEVSVRVNLLPDGAREGTWLRATLDIDAGKRDEAVSDIDSLMDELGDAP
ncbi:MAG: DUF3006 domain-containing protein [Synergistaceae bacterium]|jgi:hypothetical protein|nr:DUF3006 domain-containing protein [Synergistaceae bacterium]